MKSILVTLLLSLSLFATSAEVKEYIQSLEAEALVKNPEFKGFDALRGEKIFTSTHIGKKGKEISCVSCHTNTLSSKGENFFTGKLIDPLAPSANPERLSSVKSVKKWLRRNFKDVYKREGTPLEKGDVLMYIQIK